MQLAKLDSQAEAQVRIVDLFDTLLRNHATLEHVLRTTAGLASVPAGVTLTVSGKIIGFDSVGNSYLPDDAALSAASKRMVVSQGQQVAQVWLIDDKAPSKTADLLLERLVLTCEILWESDSLGAEARAFESLLDDGLSAKERDVMVRVLEPRLGTRIRGVCLAPSAEIEPDKSWLRRQEEKLSAQLQLRRGELLAIPHCGYLLAGVPNRCLSLIAPIPETAIGVGPLLPLNRMRQSIDFARRCLIHARAVGIPDACVSYDEIGPICLLDLENNCHIRNDEQIAAIHALLDEDPAWAGLLAAFVTQGSVRAAAKTLHLHHSSVAARLERASAVVGFDVRQAHRAFTINLALGSWGRGRSQVDQPKPPDARMR